MRKDFCDAFQQVCIAAYMNFFRHGQLGACNRRFDEALDARQPPALVGCHQRESRACLSGTTRAPDAVHIDLCVFRQVKIENMRDMIDIQATRGHVGGNKHLDQVPAETIHHAFAFLLFQFAAQRLSWEAACGELGGQFASTGPGAHENQRAGDGLNFKKTGQRRQFVGLVDQIVALLDSGDGHLLALDSDRLWLAQVAIGQAADFGWYGGRQQRRLAISRRGAEDRLDVFDEAHAQHLVGLVEHDSPHCT